MENLNYIEPRAISNFHINNLEDEYIELEYEYHQFKKAISKKLITFQLREDVKEIESLFQVTIEKLFELEKTPLNHRSVAYIDASFYISEIRSLMIDIKKSTRLEVVYNKYEESIQHRPHN